MPSDEVQKLQTEIVKGQVEMGQRELVTEKKRIHTLLMVRYIMGSHNC